MQIKDERNQGFMDLPNFTVRLPLVVTKGRHGYRYLDPRKKSLSSYEVLGHTYFLVRDRIEKRRVYETGTRFTMNPVAEESPLINRIGSRTFKLNPTMD